MKCCFWCQSQPLWLLLPQHNTCSPPQPSVQLIHWASAHIPTIHFPWRLSFPPPSLPLTLSLAPLFLSSCPPLFQSGPDCIWAANISTGAVDQSTLNRNSKDRRAQRATAWHADHATLVWKNTFTFLEKGKQDSLFLLILYLTFNLGCSGKEIRGKSGNWGNWAHNVYVWIHIFCYKEVKNGA